jgi:hypothetical protein
MAKAFQLDPLPRPPVTDLKIDLSAKVSSVDLVAVSIVAGLAGGLAGSIVFGLMATHAF